MFLHLLKKAYVKKPSIIREDLQEWFELNIDSPYMLLVANVNESKRRIMTSEEKKLFGINKLNIKRSVFI